MVELWKVVEGYPKYEISNLGRVKSKARKVEKILKGTCSGTAPYPKVSLANDSGQVSENVHRIVAKHFVPNPMDLPQVNHIDGNRKNNFASNLEWTTAKDNMRHSFNVLGRKHATTTRKGGKYEIHATCKLTGSEFKFTTFSAAQRWVIEAGLTNNDKAHAAIHNVCNPERNEKSCYGFYWDIVDLDE